MPTKQATLSRIQTTLEQAGWQSDGALSPTFRFDNGRAALELQKDFENEELVLVIEAPTGESLQLFLAYQEELELVLSAVIRLQSRISPENFREHVRDLLAVCPEVFVLDPETEESRLLEAD